MCASCACAARIVATRSSNGLLNRSVGPQSGLALARRGRTFRARRRRSKGSSRPVRAAGFLGARGTAAPVWSPTAGSHAADRPGAVGTEVEPFITVVDLDEDDRPVRRPRVVQE